jgi:hypothetical protein
MLCIADSAKGNWPMHTFDVSGIKDFAISADGTQATFALITKYSGDLGVKLPTASLKALQLSPEPGSSKSATAGQNGAGAELAPPAKNPNDVTVAIPKKWLTAADNKRGLVVVILDHMGQTQQGFALSPAAAKDLAAALVKQADAIAKDKPAKR